MVFVRVPSLICLFLEVTRTFSIVISRWTFASLGEQHICFPLLLCFLLSSFPFFYISIFISSFSFFFLFFVFFSFLLRNYLLPCFLLFLFPFFYISIFISSSSFFFLLFSLLRLLFFYVFFLHFSPLHLLFFIVQITTYPHFQ